MFKIGDSVVYPMHGAGTIESIESRQILGEVRDYYIIKILHGNMQVMVPVNGSEKAGLRGIIDPSGVDTILKVLAAESTAMDDNWNRRNRDNMEKLKTGDVAEVSEVVRNLMRMDRVRKLSTGEKKLLGSARQILISEMTLVCNIDEAEAAAMIDDAVGPVGPAEGGEDPAAGGGK